jgi:amino acid transporter
LPEQRADGPKLRRGLRPLALFGVMFVLVSGGPYGLEEMVPTSGPGLAILVLLVMGFVWGVPYCFIIAELVSAIPEQGGSYRWYRAFLGPFWSFQFSCLDWITWVLDGALYPPLLAAYLIRFFVPEAGHLTSWSVGLVVIWGCTWINIRGIELAGRLSVALTAAVLGAVAAMIVLGWSYIDLSTLRPLTPEGTSFQSALAYALIFSVWTYSGYGGLAYASEEIVDPQRNYPRVLALLLPLTVVIYVVPLLIALGATPDWASWGTAHFAQVSLVVGGTWLALLVSVGGQCGSLALFNSELLITSRLPYAMARDGVLPPVFTQLHSRYGTPSLVLVLQGLLYSVLTYFLDFVEILVVSTWISLPSYMLQFVTPHILRIRRPDLRGPFRIPGGWPVLILGALPPLGICIFVLLTVSTDEILSGLAFLALPPLLYLWSRWAQRHGADPLRGAD